LAEQVSERAAKLLTEARDLLASAEENQWQAAERIWRANHEEGVSQREIARRLDRGKTTVWQIITLWERFGSVPTDQRPSYADAYVEVGGATREDIAASATRKTLREADEETVEQIVSQLPPERQAVVAEAAIRHAAPEAVERAVSRRPQAARRVAQSALRHRDVADEVMEDPEVRMRARAAAERQAEAARAQAESERKAEAHALREDTQDVIDGRALMELGGALGRVVGTARAAAEVWKRWEPRVSDEARAAAMDDIAASQQRVDQLLDAMRGADLDATLARILAETAEEQ
jgi:hypothetical protein